MFVIKGSDFDDGVIAAGAEMICEYEVGDSGNIMMEVSVPSIGGSFPSGRNFYSRQDGQIDYTQASKLVEEQSEHALQRLDEMESKIDDPRLQKSGRWNWIRQWTSSTDWFATTPGQPRRTRLTTWSRRRSAPSTTTAATSRPT